jgi:hypothetical protein
MEAGERLPVSVPFGVPTAGEACFPALLRLGNALAAEAILLSRLAVFLQIAAKASLACPASVAVTLPEVDPARSIRTAPSVLALRQPLG